RHRGLHPSVRLAQGLLRAGGDVAGAVLPPGPDLRRHHRLHAAHPRGRARDRAAPPGHRAGGGALGAEDGPGGGDPRRAGRGRGVALLLLLLLLSSAGLGLLGYRLFERQREVDRQMASLQAKSDESGALARQALERALAAEASAQAAAEGRKAAEAETANARGEAQNARGEADAARQDADHARAVAAQAQAEAEKIRKQAEAEVNRLQ